MQDTGQAPKTLADDDRRSTGQPKRCHGRRGTLATPQRLAAWRSRSRAVLALAGTLAVGLIAPSISGATSVAAFNRFTYNDTTSTTDAAKFSVMVLGYGSGSTSQAAVRQLIASIHQTDPSVRILLYKEASVASSDPTGIGGCTGWNSSLPYGGVPMSWFLKDATGAPIYNSTYGAYELDRGNTQVQQACLSSAVSMAKQAGYNGIFWDSINTSLYWDRLKPSNCGSTTCMSNTNWHAAMSSWVTNESAGLHAQGLISIGNIGGGAVNWCCGGGSTYWQSYQTNALDGTAEESFTSGTNGLPVSPTQWKQEVANEAWNEANAKIMIANADVFSNQALNVYGMATLLLAAQGRSSWDVGSGNYSGSEFWFPQYDTALQLGLPLGSYTVQANGLYVRHFQNGTVAVNPTTAAVTDPFYGQIPAQSGQIL